MWIIVGLLLLAVPAVGQEPETEATEAIKALGEEMRAVSCEGARASFKQQLLEQGFPEEIADDLVERVQAIFGKRPIVIQRQPYGSPDFDAIDRESALQLIEKVQDLHRWKMDVRLEARMEQLDNLGVPLKRPCRGCVDAVEDCVNLIDAVYNDCIQSGHSLAYCQDLWLSLFYICEDLFDELCGLDSC